MTTAYTVGHAESYDLMLADPSVPHIKLGYRSASQMPDGVAYEGGALWQTVAEAEAFLDADGIQGRDGLYGDLYGIYELELPAPWAECAGQGAELDFHRLLKDAKILRRITP